MMIYLTLVLLICLFFCGMEVKRIIRELDAKLNKILCDQEKEG